MADTDPYQDSGLTNSLLNDTKANSDDAASNTKPQPSGSSEKPKGLLSSKGKGGLVGAIKSDFSKPAAAPATPTAGASAPVSGGTIMGGNTAISTSSMKGSALANDPSSNLQRKSEYRNVFHARGKAGKHNWGGK